MPDLHRAPTRRDRRVFPTSRSPHPPLPFFSSFLLFFFSSFLIFFFFLIFLFSSFILLLLLVASYDATLGQGPKAAPEAE